MSRNTASGATAVYSQLNSEELSFDIVWKHGGVSNTVTISCSEKAQLDQWISVMKAVSPSDALSISLDVNGGTSYVVFSDIDDLMLREESSKALTFFMIFDYVLLILCLV